MGADLSAKKIQKYQVLKCRLKREKSNFPGLNSQISNRASCIEFDFVPLWQKLWKVPSSIHHLRSGADLNGCRLYKLIFRFGACADLSGCRLKCETTVLYLLVSWIHLAPQANILRICTSEMKNPSRNLYISCVKPPKFLDLPPYRGVNKHDLPPWPFGLGG